MGREWKKEEGMRGGEKGKREEDKWFGERVVGGKVVGRKCFREHRV